MPPPHLPVGTQAPLADSNVAAVSQGQHVPTPTATAAWRANTAVRSLKRPGDLDLKSGVRVMWATSVPIFVFLGLSVLDFGPMYATDVRHCLMPPPIMGGDIIRTAFSTEHAKRPMTWRHRIVTIKYRVTPSHPCRERCVVCASAT